MFLRGEYSLRLFMRDVIKTWKKWNILYNIGKTEESNNDVSKNRKNSLSNFSPNRLVYFFLLKLKYLSMGHHPQPHPALFVLHISSRIPNDH